METIIAMVILGIISSLFSANKKDKQKQKSMPPFSGQPSTKTIETPTEDRRRPRSLEDFAKDVFQQLNEQQNPVEKPISHENIEETKAQVGNQSTSIQEEKIGTSGSNRPVFNENRTSNRSSLTKGEKIRDSIKEREIDSIVPTTKDALLKAIIASEIIGPPKARQKH